MPPLKPWLLTTPASRGIGLQVVRRLLTTTDLPVVATARHKVDEVKANILDGLKNIDANRLSVLEVDVTDERTIYTAASQIKKRFPPETHYLHLAYLLPGCLINPEKSPAQISATASLVTFRVNTLGPLLLLKHLHEFLPRKSIPLPSSLPPSLPPQAVTAIMSARVGSISDNALGGWYSYRASKAGVNQIVKTFDIYLKQRGGEKAIAIGLHPGTVKTGLSRGYWGNVKEGKLFSGEFAAERLGEVIKGIGLEGRGKCWDWEGKEVPP